MDLNADGKIDILSGSYSRKSSDMAGLLQVLWGTGDGQFKLPEALTGTDGEPLLLPGKTRTDTDKICTRASAVDLDADGKLDLVVGNFTGTFAVFHGEGDGRFSPTPSWLTNAAGERIKAGGHSDPALVDWDADGDLDLLTGSADGGAFLFLNGGSAQAPAFDTPIPVLPEPEELAVGVFGLAQITRPQRCTRVSVADVNGDGKFDLLVGDTVTLTFLLDGVDEAEASKSLGELATLQAEFETRWSKAVSDQDKEQLAELRKQIQALGKRRKEFIRNESTGFVWVLYQK